MLYNMNKIGETLRKERMNLYKNQQHLADRLYQKTGKKFSRQEIGRWENGKNLPSIGTLLVLCEFYQCDLGYLLGEHKLKTKQKTDIAAETGLSESAINGLLDCKEYHTKDLSVLNFLLSSSDFADLLERVRLYSTDVKSYHYYYDARYHNKKESLKDSEVRALTAQVHASRMYMNAAFTGIINQWEKIAEDYVTEYRK